MSHDVPAKDFRTRHATVLAVVAFAGRDAPSAPSAPSAPTALKKSVAAVMREVSGELGKTPAGHRASDVDPRVIKGFEEGVTIRAARRRLRRSSSP
ncbi:hypothetical protein GCM10022223_07080 [Kineosporia mesophila]|uniref:Uncharacterized protein n=1 Tax=Kineosporia mesophila TaxID=566012 RepID=A0ABP6Z0H4_9ACTN|nr:hypothetical protein [Kineosporia mesophila]MCD5351087.1 hypothetical protein [Kineosporia mesophila]